MPILSKTFTKSGGFWVGVSLGTMTAVSIVAAAQTAGSPFANSGQNAWEAYGAPAATPAPAPAAQPYVPPSAPQPNYTQPTYSQPTYSAPTPSYSAPSPASAPQSSYTAPSYSAPSSSYSAPTYNAPSYGAPTYNTPSYSAPTYTAPSVNYNSGEYNAPSTSASSFAPAAGSTPSYSNYQAPQQNYNYQPPSYNAPQGSGGAHYVGAGTTAPSYGSHTTSSGTQYSNDYYAASPNNYGGGYNSSPYGQAPQGQQGQAPYGYGPQSYPAPPKQGFLQRLGLRDIQTTLSGFLRLGAAGTKRKDPVNDGWSEDFVGDAQLRGEVSAITQGGVEYGYGTEIRAQYDPTRKGFGGRVGDCPPSVAGCGSTLVAGTPTAIRGHTSQFYTSEADNEKEFEVAVEGAYFFLRSAYGDFTVGRDDGAAYLFSLGAPSVVMVNGSNSPVDYTGLDSVKTLNDASGFAEKISYVSPRVLGDTIGVGVQIGVSYAPDALACGVDYCVTPNGAGSTVLSPDLENVIEAGLSLDRKFENGLSIEATATYARASEKSGIAEFDNLQAIGAGLEVGMGDFTIGGSYLNSNNGLQDGDYEAYDVGLQWKPGRLGASLGYGHATDENARLTSDQGTFGLSYDVNDRFQLGTGVQYIARKVSAESGGVLSEDKEKAMAIFIEGGIKF